jgi:hypothetical protein
MTSHRYRIEQIDRPTATAVQRSSPPEYHAVCNCGWRSDRTTRYQTASDAGDAHTAATDKEISR